MKPRAARHHRRADRSRVHVIDAESVLVEQLELLATETNRILARVKVLDSIARALARERKQLKQQPQKETKKQAKSKHHRGE